MQRDTVIGLKIAYYRRLNGLTQEELAERVGVSCQAVSKWEQRISCPDIMLLPKLARIFGVTIDDLFGNSSDREIVYSLVNTVPWNDDGNIRVAIYSGRKLMEHSEHACSEGTNLIDVRFHGAQYHVSGVCKIHYNKEDAE